jgi:PknH-like extracellular domain
LGRATLNPHEFRPATPWYALIDLDYHPNGGEHVRHITTAIAVVGISILAAGCSTGSHHATKTSTTTTTTTTTTTAPPVPEGALDGLLLGPDQVNAAMAATGMTVTSTHTSMSDDSATMAPKECLAIDGSAQAQVYAGSGYTAERDQTLQEGDNFAHYVKQSVVFFPTAQQPSAFFAASAQQWPACRQYTHTQSGSQWTAGPVSNTNGTLSTIATQLNPKAGGWACGRALVIRNNIVVDVNTCSANPADSAVNIANQIAAKIPTQGGA